MIQALLVGLLVSFLGILPAIGQTPTPGGWMDARCTRVVDGDTIRLRGGETVRLLGIDTPELGEPYARDAKLFTLRAVAHHDLRLEFDRQLRDSYGRLLAYVYVDDGDDMTMVNEELVRVGLARLLFFAPNVQHRDRLEAAFYEAVVTRRGLWGAVPGTLSVEDLENQLVAYVTEVVTVAFEVGSVTRDDGDVVLWARGASTGFHVRVPELLIEALSFIVSDALLGTTVTVTGFLGCRIAGDGPNIVVQYPGQLRLGEPTKG